MRRPTTLAVMAVAGAALMACHTITEEMPSRPTSVQVTGGGIPTIVVPVPNQTPPPSPSSPIVTNPNPRPEPTPVGGGDGGGGGGGGGEPPGTHRSPVRRPNAP